MADDATRPCLNENIAFSPMETLPGQSFTAAYLVDQTPEEVFDAVNNVRGWWSGNIEGDTDKLGAEFTYRYKKIHMSKQKITEFVPGKKVVWHVLDSYLSFVKEPTEWTGTNVTFDISRKGDKTELRFTHVGLVPEFECYGDCSSAWSFYVNGSLKKLIAKGQPNRKAKTVSKKTVRTAKRTSKPRRPSCS